MQANYTQCLSFVLAEEGGWSDDPRDPGGATMHGITLTTYRHYRPGATADDLRSISAEEVSAIYHSGYWSPIRGDDLPAGLDLLLIDEAVNAGPGSSAKMLQQCLGVTADGAIGPATLAAIAGQEVARIISRVSMQQEAHYRALPSFATFGRGWLARCERRRVAALQMVTACLHPAAAPTVAVSDNDPAKPATGGLLGALAGVWRRT